MAATMHVIAATIAVIFLTSSPCDAMTKDIKIEYYSMTVLRCDENKTDLPGYTVFWITPDASLIHSNTPASEFPKNVKLVDDHLTMLNVTKVDDDQFGFYTCVMVKDSDKSVSLMRWGVNVDGADFSELEKEYRDSAIIGAIAAGVMLVVVGGACVIWNYRYSRRSSRENSERSSSIEEDLRKPASHLYVNQGYDSQAVTPADIEMVETPEDKANGSAAVTDRDAGQENGESLRM